MPINLSDWFGVSGDVAAWIALGYLIYTFLKGSPELRTINQSMDNMEQHYERIERHFERVESYMDKYITALIEKL